MRFLNANLFSLVTFVAMVSSVFVADSSAEISDFITVDDGEVRVFGGDSVDTSGGLLDLFQSGANLTNLIFEFDLSSLSSSATITSAELLLVHDRNLLNTGGVPVPIEAFAYAGDGAVTIGDFDAAGAAVGTFGVPLGTTDGAPLSFGLDNIAGLQTAVNSGSGALTIRLETESFSRVEFASLENASFAPPTLRVATTAVPEPSSLFGMALIGVGFLVQRRRRR